MPRLAPTARHPLSWPALVGAILLACSGVAGAQATATLEVDVSQPGVAIPPEFFGLMTEEINHAYDGGLFAELVQNQTFQDPRPERRGPGGGGRGGGHDRL